MSASSPDLSSALANARAWPFEEARRLIARLDKINGGAEKTVIFETGYGPSGLPHIGTFGEVARTSMVRHAFEMLTEGKRPTRLICFSDDMDGLRKVPTNVPNQELLHSALERPLTRVPDPFGKFESFAHHNNAMLRAFLDQFGFSYEFMSATDAYTSGRFDETLLRMLEVYDKVMDIILPTLGPERRATYSPFLPVSPTSGKVLQVPMIERDPKKGTIVYIDPDSGEKIETTVTGGAVKCQWKADWALRWTALGVDYEMAGKDLIESVQLSSRICKALGGTPPEGFNYELFLDDRGEKISKSKGNGLTIDEWLSYASPESLSLFMYQKPKSAKRLYFDVIPRAVDEYLQLLAAYPRQDDKARLDNAVWHIHTGTPPTGDVPLTFALLLNLVAASNADDKAVLWGFIRRHVEGVSPETHPLLDQLAGYAVRYYTDFVKPQKKYRPADEVEVEALRALSEALANTDPSASAEDLQAVIYDVGRTIPRYQDFNAKNATPERPGVSNAWFGAIYQVLLGEEKGPRFGSFVQVYGISETRALIDRAMKGELLA
ncbi:lysine--tRNA ligase [Hyphomicrobium sulfonivorans]|uniref:lysine--tRNA ligase n=1 Tax=Hyphomicrobium sulfonivorans TaxID=121290 RepID=UPI00156E0B24|nr:lysine--tRNA ligase [Hyphomicrobium sulfonivorans]MBI1649657.1 lysine--tRNA ligase [Hyphomicrobium sulfonivorans]NSL71573.1 lysine--tRNA ligase [Hyphomicrobium sulfonivorans]